MSSRIGRKESDERIQKKWIIPAMEYHEASEKEILPHAATKTNLQDTVLSEKSQSQKDKYRMSPPTGSV